MPREGLVASPSNYLLNTAGYITSDGVVSQFSGLMGTGNVQIKSASMWFRGTYARAPYPFANHLLEITGSGVVPTGGPGPLTFTAPFFKNVSLKDQWQFLTFDFEEEYSVYIGNPYQIQSNYIAGDYAELKLYDANGNTYYYWPFNNYKSTNPNGNVAYDIITKEDEFQLWHLGTNGFTNGDGGGPAEYIWPFYKLQKYAWFRETQYVTLPAQPLHTDVDIVFRTQIQDSVGIFLSDITKTNKYAGVYQAGNNNSIFSQGGPRCFVDDIEVFTRNDLYVALHDSTDHEVKITNIDISHWNTIALGQYASSGTFNMIGTIYDIKIIRSSSQELLHYYKGDGKSNSNWQDHVGDSNGQVSIGLSTIGDHFVAPQQTAVVNFNLATDPTRGRTLRQESPNNPGFDAFGAPIADPRRDLLNFSGFEDTFAVFPYTPELNVVNEFDLFVWGNFYASHAADKRFVDRAQTNNVCFALFYESTSTAGNVRLVLSDDGVNVSVIQVTVPNKHIGLRVAFDGALGGAKIYKYDNGAWSELVPIEIVPRTINAIHAAETSILIPGSYAATGAEQWEGQMSPIWMYNRILEDYEVDALTLASKYTYGE